MFRRVTTRDIIALILLALVAYIIATMLNKAFPEGNTQLLNIFLGIILAEFKTLMSYYFHKADTPAEIAERGHPPQPPPPPRPVPPPPPPTPAN